VTMTEQEIDIAIAEALGVEPELVEWWAHKPDDTGGSICMSAQTKQEVEEWIRKNPDYAKGYSPKAFYRYPPYCNDLNAMHGAEKKLSLDKRDLFLQALYRICDKAQRMTPVPWLAVNATARQRAEAFLRTLNLWVNET